MDFPVVGKVKIAGLSGEEVKALLRDKLSDYLKEPIINIRLRNFTISVLGEVHRLNISCRWRANYNHGSPRFCWRFDD
ncbi:polysaccharide biosynthesis/export family protein [Zobellia laminariae]|uniref:polysaccharide biosynthesis/export family protein n=1 Tax=Zobellia laminariae TaxID=248906 RepID=UPI0034CF2E49